MTETESGREFLKNLRRQGGRERQTFDAFSSYLLRKAKEQGVPLYGEFELTPFCNLNCRMCYVHLTQEQANGRSLLSVDQWKDLIRQAYQAGMIHATLTGGECLTYPGFKELFLYLHSLGCEVSVFTNGVLLDQEWLEFFKAHMPAEIQITLYGNSDETYRRVTGVPAFTKVVEHIKIFHQSGLPVKICVTPSVYLGEDVFETIRTAYELFPNVKINSNLFTPKEETGRSGQGDDPDVEMYIRMFRYVASLRGQTLQTIDEARLPETGCPADGKQKPCGLLCGAGRGCFSIDWKGMMVPCSMLREIMEDPLRIGFEQAWKRINKAANSWPRPAECEGCAYASVCNNCAAYMKQFAKPGDKPEELCRNTKKLVSAGVFSIPDCE